jgi:hypothetical protein
VNTRSQIPKYLETIPAGKTGTGSRRCWVEIELPVSYRR